MLALGENIPREARSDAEIQSCFDVISELRTHLKRDEFLETVRRMAADGFQLAYIEVDGEIVVVAGYRIYTNLHVGKNLYVDDLITAELQRSKGYGQSMVHWLRGRAESEDCEFFRLDSGITRGQAHKFYFNQGFSIAAYHFVERLINDSDTS